MAPARAVLSQRRLIDIRNEILHKIQLSQPQLASSKYFLICRAHLNRNKAQLLESPS